MAREKDVKTKALSVNSLPSPPEVLELAKAAKGLRGELGKEFARAIISDPLYLEGLIDRARAGKLAPAVEVTLLHYAFGKPKEQIEVKKATLVKIVHTYDDEESAAELAQQALDVIAVEHHPVEEEPPAPLLSDGTPTEDEKEVAE